MGRHKKKNKIRWRSVFLWHRYLGLVATTFVLILTLTGLVLSHTDSLKLSSKKVDSKTLLGWYGIKAPDFAVSYRAGNNWVSQFGKHIYFNEKEITGASASLTGALIVNNIIVVAGQDTVFLLTDEGEFIERLSGVHGVPDMIERIGLDSTGQLVVQAGSSDYTVDDNFLEWEKTEAVNVDWVTKETVSDIMLAKLVNAHRGSGLSMERVMLDIHSGRILGVWGVYLMDAIVVLFLVLSISGVWVWATRKK